MTEEGFREVCNGVFSRDPVLYLDMTEPVRRGEGEVLSADENGALVRIQTRGMGWMFTMFAETVRRAEELCRMIPDGCVVLSHETLTHPLLCARFGYTRMAPCWQVGYLSAKPFPVPDSPFTLRPLTEDDLPAVVSHYALGRPEYVRKTLARGEMIGAYDGEVLAGFIGRHEEGTLGMLEVFPAYRRRGLGTLLQICATNQSLERGEIPYGQVFADNEASLALQRKMGFTRSAGYMYWPSHAEDETT